MSKKRVLITGASGFIGSHLLTNLKNNYDVVGTVRTNLSCDSSAIEVCDWSRTVCHFEAIDTIIHTAALNPSPGKTFADYYYQNVIMAENLVTYARNNNVNHIIYCGAVSSFGRVDGVLNENSLHCEPDDYGLSKYVAEKIIESSGLPVTTLIFPGVVGEKCRATWLINIAKKLKLNENVECFNSEGAFNNVVDVADICSFIGTLLNDNCDPSDRILLGATDLMVVKDVIMHLAQKVDSKSTISFKNDVGNGFYLDVSHAKERGFLSRPIVDILNDVCDKYVG